MDRRKFLGTAALGAAAMALEAQEQKKKDGKPAESKTEAPAQTSYKKPVIICAANGYNSVDNGYDILMKGGDTLDACIAVGNGPEDNPNDSSVGLGGLPNEEGVVELDASCMHGPTRRAAAAGAVHWTKNPSKLVKAIMEHTGHVMLCDEGADRFAKAMGFPKDELLTERSRMTWQLWKEYHSFADWWGPGLWDPNYQLPGAAQQSPDIYHSSVYKLDDLAAEIGIPPEFRAEAIQYVLHPPTGTIHISALKENGEMSGLTTTSGLAWKIPSRLGDSPIIGAGCYTDQDVGSAGATGSGEENIRVAGAHTVIENMRHGMSPLEAGLDALKRIVRNYNNDMNKLKYVSMTYYILRKDGAYAAVSLWSGRGERPPRYCVHDGQKRYENTVPLLQGVGSEYPPIPDILRQKWQQARQARQ
jgi:N4-(beta-N-acetylglucosaminyl)-L-asparaginase